MNDSKFAPLDGERRERQRSAAEINWQSLAEYKIQQAQREGAFDNLPGFGKPLPEDFDQDELWWVKKKMREEGLSLLPPSLQIRVDIHTTLERIWTLPSEPAVRREVEALNQRISQANYTSVVGPMSSAMPLSIEQIVKCWQERQNEDSLK